MNPLSHAQFAQDTHREYEANYGNRYRGSETRRRRNRQLSGHKVVLALCGVSIAAVMVAVVSIF